MKRMTRQSVGRASLVAVAALLGLAAVGHAAPRWKTVDLGARGYGTVRVAGRTVRDLAVADRLIVGVKGSVSTAAAAHSRIGALGGKVRRSLGNGQVLVVDLPEGSDVVSVAQKLVGQAGVRFAEPDRLVYATAIPADPEYGSQWHLPKIQAPLAWDLSTGSTSVTIAFVDSGIDLNHPDLVDRIWTNADEIAGNGKDDDNNGYVDDVHGWNFLDNNADVRAIPNGIDEDLYHGADDQVNHGTLGAGTAVASANGFGCVGVSWQTLVMMLKVFPDDGSTSLSVVIEAMYYAARNGADIMNLSIGAGYSESFTPPIVELWERGGLTVSAAGNDNDRITDSQSSWVSPACNNGDAPLVDNMNLGVGGLDQQDRKASWSNYDDSTAGNFIEVFAPGMNIYGPAVYWPSVSGFSSYFGTNSGTSFSAPMVSGLAALLKAQLPSRTGAELLQIIRSTCDSVDSVNPGYAGQLGAGRINAARALGVDVPPAAVTELTAADTADDQGGSVTLTWVKSADDGAGSGEVTGYAVSRADGALPAGATASAASWVDLATLAAGSTSYVDTTTTDGVDYYYRVATLADGHRVETNPVGPVTSVDDSAPPRVTDLAAVDHPGDSGGQIDLTWITYTGSGDLAGFHIYRATRAFATIAGKTPLATLNSILARGYEDRTTVDGADYYYAVVPFDALGNARPDVIVAGPVQSYSNTSVQFAAGLQMLAAPVIPADAHPATLLGLSTSALRYGRWSPVLGAYEKYAGEPLPPSLNLALGRGFFVNLPNATAVSPAGNVAPAGDFDVELVVGWQQLGNPFRAPLDYADSTVTYNGTTMDLISADAAGVVRSWGWVYNSSTNGYELVHPTFGATTLVAPWRGFWVYAEQACTLTLARPAGTTQTSATPSSAAPAPGEWVVQLVAQGAGNVDSANYFGVSSTGNGILSPPAPGDGVELSFEGAPGLDQSVSTATALYGSDGNRLSWNVRVNWGEGQGRIALRWPDLSSVPARYGLTLRDPSTGATVSMRHQSGYVLEAGQTSGSRLLQIVATSEGSWAAQITAMSAQTTGAGAEVVFSLSAAAACDVVVLNMAGRPVRTVVSGKTMGAGVNSVAWDGRGTTGSRAPSGTYLVRVTARTADGTVSSALRSLRLTR